MTDTHFTDAEQMAALHRDRARERLAQITPGHGDATVAQDTPNDDAFLLLVAVHDLMGVALFLHEDLCKPLLEEIESLLRQYR